MERASNQVDVHPTYQQIEERAYMIYVAEGCPQGRCDAHWHLAEEQLRAELTKVQVPPTSPTVTRRGRLRK